MKTRIGIVLLTLISAMRALGDPNQPSSVLIDFPLSQNMAVPIWMNTPQVAVGGDGEQLLRIPILPQSTNEGLLLTACFQEQSGTRIQVEWVDASGTVTLLSNDLSEAIGIANQRSVLIGSSTIGDGGTLVISGESLLNRVKLEWLKPGDSLLGEGAPSLLVAPASQPTVSSDEVSGETPSVTQNQWKGKVVETTFVNSPERNDTPVEYPMSLEVIPDMARLRLKVDGLPFGQHLVVWLNQKRAGNIQPSVPDLNDPGYVDPSHFTGWRDGTLLIPRALFKIGENDLQLSAESDASPPDPSSQPFAVRNVAIQFMYAESDNSESSSSSAINNSTAMPSAEPTPSGQSDPLSPGTANIDNTNQPTSPHSSN